MNFFRARLPLVCELTESLSRFSAVGLAFFWVAVLHVMRDAPDLDCQQLLVLLHLQFEEALSHSHEVPPHLVQLRRLKHQKLTRSETLHSEVTSVQS